MINAKPANATQAAIVGWQAAKRQGDAESLKQSGDCVAELLATRHIADLEVIRAAIGSLAYACGALDAPTFSTMRQNLADLETLLSDTIGKA